MEQQIRPVTFTAKDAAKCMGIPYGTILTMAKRQMDQLLHGKIGSKFTFRKEALDKWMTDHDAVKIEVVRYDFRVSLSSSDILGRDYI